MQNPRPTFTVLMIPEIGRRTLSFRLSLPSLVLLLLVAPFLLSVIAVQYYANRSFKTALAEMESLQQINQEQRTQISQMKSLAAQAETKLEQLTELEREIRAMTSSAQSGRGAAPMEQSLVRGRGGPRTGLGGESLIPTLSAYFPKGVGDYLFRPNQAAPIRPAESAAQGLSEARTTGAQMSNQLLHMADLRAALTNGQKAMAAHLEFRASVPAGMPIAGAAITSRFGWRWSPLGRGSQMHKGIDLAHDYWAPIVATGAGTVVHAGWKYGGYGNTVIIDHGYGLESLYAHMIDWDVVPGDRVERGTVIGWVGSSGDSTGPHLHYEVHLDGEPVDPANYF